MGPTPPDPGAAGPLRRGTVIAGRYRLEHPLATGGMARVWTATDEVLGRPVAVKLLLEQFLADDSFVRRFRAEALAAARLTHPSVVAVYDTCSVDGIEAIVMELVEGTTLRARMDDEGILAVPEACRIAGRVADALSVAHRAKVVHRDIKPANVLLSTTGRVVVTDFGIAKAAEAGDLTGDHQMLGTAKYLAPEQVEGKPVDGRSDLYALGVVLYEMLCGGVPFRADTEAATALARLHQDPRPPRLIRPEIPPEVEQVVLRLLARWPEDRWPEAASLTRTLGAVAAGRALPPLPPGPTQLRSAARTAAPAAPAAPPRAAPPPPPPRPDPTVPPARDDPPAGRPPRRPRPLTPMLLVGVLLAVALLVVGALGWRLLGSGGTQDIRPSAAAFDPFGDQGENDADARLATDGDPASAWQTERYNDPDVSRVKSGGDGVGLLLDLGESRSVDALSLVTAEAGWAGEVYVLADAPGDDSSGWGEPVAGGDDLSDRARLDLGGAEGRYVLLWITRTAEDGRVQIADAVLEVQR